jgi:pyruvate dehydrogenase complex dehydrogenase (E1) component
MRCWAASCGGKPNVKNLVDSFDDDGLAALMTNLGGHCIETLIDAFDSANDERPTIFTANTGLIVRPYSTLRLSYSCECSFGGRRPYAIAVS